MIHNCYRVIGYLCIATLFLVVGCSYIPVFKSSGSSQAVPFVDKSEPLNKKEEPPAETKPQATGQKEVTVPRPVQPKAKIKKDKQVINSLAILLSEGNSRDQEIADALEQQLGKPTEQYYLNTAVEQQLEVIKRLQGSSHRYVVAIGSTAANLAKNLKHKRVVFSQVFNYQADGLLDAGFSGVSMVPSTKVLMRQWKKLSPSLDRIAVITGPKNEQQIKNIIKMARQQRVSIEHYVVNNDKEMLYTVQQAAAGVQGFWMLPDNRVLSLRGMKDFMSYTMKHNKQVAVFNRKLLEFGGLFYVTVKPDYVAKQIINAVKSPASTVLGLHKAQVEVNKSTVQRLNLMSNVI